MAEDVSKPFPDMPREPGVPATGTSALRSPLRSTTARERIGNAITELEALVNDLNTLIKTLTTIRERL